MDSTVIYQSKNGLCYLTLNRPDVFNALNRQLVLDLTAALKQAESETEVRVVILKGAGNPGRTRQNSSPGLNRNISVKKYTHPWLLKTQVS